MNLSLVAALAIAAAGLSACSTMNAPSTGPQAATSTHQHCSMYREAMGGKPVAEQRAAVAAHMTKMHGSADEAQVDQYLRMMEAKCGGAPAAGVIGLQPQP